MGGPFRVLHVDDNPDIAELTATFLEREEETLAVEPVTSAADGLERLEANEFDCVVSDYDMPRMDGIEFLQTVRERERDLPFILFTGKGSEEIASEAISAGVTDYLQKEPGAEQYTILANRITNAIDRAEAKATARQSQERYRSLFENNPLALWEEDYSEAKPYADAIADRTDDFVGYLDDHPEELDRLMSNIEVIDVNQNAVEYYGADSKAHLVDNLDTLMTDTGRDVNKRLWRNIAEGRTRFREETLTRLLDGTLRNELLELYVPDQYAEDYSRLYIAVTDITEHKERERELERQNEQLDEFVGLVSHDLRGPLTRAVGHLELATDACDRGDAEAVEEHLGTIAAAHSQMEAMIDDLLALARERQIEAEGSPVSIAAVAERSVRRLSSPPASLVTETDRLVIADVDRFTQLLENLVRNAVQHGGSAVAVRVGGTEDGFFVADDGPGIDPDDRDRIFDTGFSTSEDGTGFGLSIVTAIADAHGWTVSVTESERGGARFEFGGVEFADD